MPTPTKKLDNMSKHLTADEIKARERAETSILPARALKKVPKVVKEDKTAYRHWKQTLKDMKGLEILDILDTDILEIYCVLNSRREDLMDRYLVNRKYYWEADPADESVRATLNKTLREMNKDLQALESLILQYATKLGLTPDGRLRLAKKAAEEAADGEDDFFA